MKTHALNRTFCLLLSLALLLAALPLAGGAEQAQEPAAAVRPEELVIGTQTAMQGKFLHGYLRQQHGGHRCADAHPRL